MQISLDIPQKLTARVALPASKSVSNRALLLQALCSEKRCAIANLAACDDTDHMLQGIEAKRAGAPLIDIGATGTAMRFLTAYLAITEGETVITGSERMQQRPIGTLVEALQTLGADIAYINKEGYPPLRICGRQLQGGKLEIEAGISSQYISALLMIAPCLTDGLTLYLKGNIASRTYIELTLDLMRKYGAVAE
jgi:3-phosphoshikimate 1-carboxyvinyltransferase